MKFSEVISMRECRWTARHLHQYLDRDPAAPLSAEEELRLTHHLEICDKCASLSDQYKEISRELHKWRSEPDEGSVQRITAALAKAIENGEESSAS